MYVKRDVRDRCGAANACMRRGRLNIQVVVNRLCQQAVSNFVFVREDSAPGSTHTCTPRGNTVCMHNIQVYTQQDNTQLPLATYGYGMQPYVSPAMFSATDSHHTGKIMDQLHQHTVQILSVCQSYGVWGADTTQWKTAQRGRNDRTTGCGRRVPSNCSSDYLASKGSESSLETCTGSLIWEKKLPPTTAEEDRCAGDWGQPSP